MHTEAEAKTLACPHLPTAYGEVIQEIHDVAGVHEVRRELPAPCLASACMMWRWADPAEQFAWGDKPESDGWTDQGIKSRWNGDATVPTRQWKRLRPMRTGFCGLAGEQEAV